jgi:uncharacterized protein (TIGR02996 family)
MPVKPTRRVLEDALAADFDDLAAHAAYADLLMEQGDPRGEFIRAQLLMEDPALPAATYKRLHYYLRDTFWRYGYEWLGGLADLICSGNPLLPMGIEPDLDGNMRMVCDPRGNESELIHLSFGRGWLTDLTLQLHLIEMGAPWVTHRLMNVLSVGTLACCLRTFTWTGDWPHPVASDALASWLMPDRVPALRRLILENQAANSAICRVILASGILSQLEELRLRSGRITHADANVLFDAPDLDRLKVLDLSGNGLAYLDQFRPAGIPHFIV